MRPDAGLRWVWAPVVMGLVSAAALLGPWLRSGTVDRSSVDLIGSATALDVLSGTTRVVVVGAWLTVVVLVAVALVTAAWDRPRVALAVLLPVGPLLVAAWILLAGSPLEVRWGAVMAGISGAVTSILAAGMLKN